MNDNSDRNAVIALLEQLGGENDAEVLTAARALHVKIGEIGVNWDQLLVPDDDETPEPAEPDYDEDEDDDELEDEDDELEDDEDELEVDKLEEEDDEDEDEDDDTDDAATLDDADDLADEEFEPVGDAADDIKLINALLATSGISSEFKDELKGYKKDIKAKEFTAADRTYIQALRNRLAGNKKSKPRRKS